MLLAVLLLFFWFALMWNSARANKRAEKEVAQMTPAQRDAHSKIMRSYPRHTNVNREYYYDGKRWKRKRYN